MRDPGFEASSLRQVLGALIFGAERPVGIDALRRCLQDVAREAPDTPNAGLFAEAAPSDVRAAIEDLTRDLARLAPGFEIVEVAGGYRVQTQPECGGWVRRLLSKAQSAGLSQPALETLAIVAYRQPITRADIEGIRGVAVGHVLKALIELRLVRIAARSDLPGRPFLYGTTTTFLEHFGLKHLRELEDIDPTLTRERLASVKNSRQPAKESPGEPAPENGVRIAPENFAEDQKTEKQVASAEGDATLIQGEDACKHEA